MINYLEVGRYWDENADAWTLLSRAGYDVYRDGLNTPAFLALLPAIAGLCGLDIGCGEGHNTRQLARNGARMTGIDISGRFIYHAQELENQSPLGITYQVASATALPFPDQAFDFATGFMCLMDIPDSDRVMAEVYRVLKPGGFFQFSISHPCFDLPHRRTLRSAGGSAYAVEVGGYFLNTAGRIDTWIFGAAPKEATSRLAKFRVPRFSRTLSQWVNLLIDTGFRIERLDEPRPDDEAVEQFPALQDAQVIAYFLHVRVRK